MKKLIKGRSRIILIAAAILIVCVAVFVVSTQIAMGAEENKTVSQESTYAAGSAPQVSGEAVINNDPGSGFITGEQAVDAYIWTATEIFGVSVDKSALSVRFESEPNMEGIVHNEWYINSQEYSCGVDAETGTVIYFESLSRTYPGSSITLGEFNTEFDSSIRGNPNNIYITAARDIVTSKLAQGRKIDYIDIDGIGFVWDDEDGGFGPDETGTIGVDCHVYMETGMCYTLTYWGTDEIALNRFFSNPTKQACEAGFYFLDQADDNPPYGWKGPWPGAPEDWQAAPGITEGTHTPEG